MFAGLSRHQDVAFSSDSHQDVYFFAIVTHAEVLIQEVATISQEC